MVAWHNFVITRGYRTQHGLPTCRTCGNTVQVKERVVSHNRGTRGTVHYCWSCYRRKINDETPKIAVSGLPWWISEIELELEKEIMEQQK